VEKLINRIINRDTARLILIENLFWRKENSKESYPQLSFFYAPTQAKFSFWT